MSKTKERHGIIENYNNSQSEYVAEYGGRKYVYVCRNNGQFHRGNGKNIAGFATFVGRYDWETFVDVFIERKWG